LKNSDPHARWLMIGLVFSATVINYLNRQTLSVLAPVLISQFHMSSVSYSRVISAFMLAYTIMNGVSGPLIDRLGTRLGYALTMVWWSVATMLQGLARGAWSLGVFSFLLGMGEAGNWPAGVKVVAEWFPVEERALASGLFNSGSSVGAILAPPLVVTLALAFGWRVAFLVVGSLGLIWLLFWLFKYYTPVQAKQQEASWEIGVWGLLRTRFVWSFTLSKLFMDPVWYFYIFWFPQYLKQGRHFDLASIGKYAWIPFLLAGLGNIAGGWTASALLRRGFTLTTARKGAVTAFAILMASAIPAVLVSDARLSMALVSLAMFGYTGCTANMLAFPADAFPKSVVASIWGLAGLGSGLGGMAFALLTGWVVDRYSYVPAFFGFGMMPMISVLILWFLLGPLQPRTTELVG